MIYLLYYSSPPFDMEKSSLEKRGLFLLINDFSQEGERFGEKSPFGNRGRG